MTRTALLLLVVATSGCAPPVACRVRETYGAVAGAHRVHQLSADGRVLAIDSREPGGEGHVAFDYDAEGRLVRRRSESTHEAYRAPHPSPLDRPAGHFEETVEYEYDRDGKKRRARRGSTVETYRWDGDRLVEIRRRGSDTYAWTMRYDGARLVEVRHVVDGRVTMKRDYEYDAAGRRVRESFSADFLAAPWSFSYEYDTEGRFVARSLLVDGRSLPRERVERDARGRIVRVSIESSETRFSYDGDGRILRIERTGEPARQFQHGDGCTSAMTKELVSDPLERIWTWPEVL